MFAPRKARGLLNGCFGQVLIGGTSFVVGRWALTNSVEVWYSWPSLVDHLDEKTTINHADGMGRSEGRRAWRTGKPIPHGKTIMIK